MDMPNICRSTLGPDLVFVVLNMDMEEVRKRVLARHHGEESAVEMMEVNFNEYQIQIKLLISHS